MPHTEAVNSMPYTAAASKGPDSIEHRPAERRVYCTYTRVECAGLHAIHTLAVADNFIERDEPRGFQMPISLYSGK